MSDREATSELSSSVCEGASYDKVFPSGHKPKEDFPQSLEREPSTQSLSDENEEEDEGDVEGNDYDEGERNEEDEDNEEDNVDDEGT